MRKVMTKKIVLDVDEPLKTVGERLKFSRLRAGLTQDALAKAIGKYGRQWPVARTSVLQWENGKVKNMEAANLLRAAKVLSVSPNWLVFGYEL